MGMESGEDRGDTTAGGKREPRCRDRGGRDHRWLGRRHLLSVAAGTIVATAGCTGGEEEPAVVNETADQDPTTHGGDGVVLTTLEIVSFSQEASEFHVMIEQDGEIVLWNTYRTAAEGNQSPGRSVVDLSPTTADETIVLVRVADQWTSATFDEEGRCVRARVVSEPQEGGSPLSIYRQESNCPQGIDGEL